MKLQVWLEWFPKAGGFIEGQEPIRHLTDQDYAKVFKLDKEDGGRVLGDYRVNKTQARFLQPYVTHVFDFDKYKYYISPAAVDDKES